MVCLPEEVEAFNANGAVVRFPVRGRDGFVEVCTNDLPGHVNAAGPDDVDPADFDLVTVGDAGTAISRSGSEFAGLSRR